jgi:hypothetical protein
MTVQLAEGRTAVAHLPSGRGRGPGGQLTALTEGSANRCPVSGCVEQIDPSRLMCRRDWYLVPKQMRDLVWTTWRSGQGASSGEHREAVRTAIVACQVVRLRR